MSMHPFHELTIESFHEGLLQKKFSAREIAQAFLGRIKETDGDIGAYLSVFEESAVREAEQVDRAIAKDEPIGALAGVPIAIKDNILIKNERATAGSKILENYTASYDATVIKKLKECRAVFLGKTNLDEFAMGSSTENSAFKTTRNPHDTTRVPGGSSGGSAAAVAGGMAIAALGSDTGGSIREPASFCGVVGLKPTYGAVSRSGLIAMASSLDQIGPITKTVRDARLVFNAIKGADSLDSTSSPQVDATSAPPSGGESPETPKREIMQKLTIGLPEEYFIDGLDKNVASAVEEAIMKLKSLGLRFKKVSLPHTKSALSAYYIIMPAEVSANLARFDGIRYAQKSDIGYQRSDLRSIYFKQRSLFGDEPKRRIILGTFVLSSGYYDAYYAKAQKVRALVAKDFNDAFRDVDVLLTPVAPTPAFKIGEKTDDPLAMYLGDIFTIPVNLAGLPAISIPVQSVISYTLKAKSLPVGFQLIGKPFRETDILGIGEYYERLAE